MKRMDSDLKRILNKYSIIAKKNFGQNFLLDLDILDIIKEFIKDDDHEIGVEIGCGIGTLTRFLVDRYEHVIGYEIENDMITVLENEYNFANLELIKEDFIKSDISFIDEKMLVIGNIPYNITAKVIKKILSLEKPISFSFMVQKEVARKFEYKPGDTNNHPLSVYLALCGEYKILCDVSNTSFLPSPRVESSFISYRANKTHPQWIKLLERLFINPHKILKNNLKHLDKHVITDLMSVVSLNKRVHQLTLEEFNNILKIISNDIDQK